MIKVLVTGCHGFLGTALCEKLIQNENVQLYGVDREIVVTGAVSKMKRERATRLEAAASGRYQFRSCDLSDMPQVFALFADISPQVVVHYAGQYSVRHSTAHALSYLRNNCLAFGAVLEASRINSVQRFVYASSVAADAMSAMYGVTKRFNELLGTMYTLEFGMRIIGLRYPTVYGPWVRPDMQVYQLLDTAINERVCSTPDKFEYGINLFVADAIECTIRFLNYNCPHGVYTLTNSRSVSLPDIAAVIEQLTGKPVRWAKDERMIPRGAPFVPNTEMLKASIDYVPQTNLKDGMQKMLEWYKEMHK